MPDTAIALDAEYTRRQINGMLAAYPDLQDDETLRADMLDAECDLYRIMSRLVRARQERLAHVDGINGYIADLTDRKDRMERAADGLKTLMLVLMNAADMQKMNLHEATISVGKARQNVVISDEGALPQGYFTTVVKPDKKAIKGALEVGDDIPGASLESSGPTLTVRTR